MIIYITLTLNPWIFVALEKICIFYGFFSSLSNLNLVPSLGTWDLKKKIKLTEATGCSKSAPGISTR